MGLSSSVGVKLEMDYVELNPTDRGNDPLKKMCFIVEAGRGFFFQFELCFSQKLIAAYFIIDFIVVRI